MGISTGCYAQNIQGHYNSKPTQVNPYQVFRTSDWCFFGFGIHGASLRVLILCFPDCRFGRERPDANTSRVACAEGYSDRPTPRASRDSQRTGKRDCLDGGACEIQASKLGRCSGHRRAASLPTSRSIPAPRPRNIAPARPELYRSRRQFGDNRSFGTTKKLRHGEHQLNHQPLRTSLI